MQFILAMLLNKITYIKENNILTLKVMHNIFHKFKRNLRNRPSGN